MSPQETTAPWTLLLS